MNYTGKLYGKLGSIRFDTGKTADDWDSMEKEVSELREQVRSLREGLGEMISTIERNAVDNRATIENVKLWAKSWREELLTETEG